MSTSIDNSPGRTRVESWKEIASFFGRDERTVKRWEKSRRLPVRRLPGAKGGVFAYSDELLQWLHSRSGEPAASIPDDLPQPQIAFSAPPSSPEQQLASALPAVSVGHRELLWLTPLLLVLAVVALESHRFLHLRDAAGTAPRPSPAASVHPNSPASELYLRGRYYWSHRTQGTLQQAADAFSQAIARDPNYAPAYAGLADSYNLMPEYTGMPEAKALPIALQAARKAVALDDSLSEAHRALAYGLFFWNWDAQQAFPEFRRAAQLDPSDEDVHAWFAHALFTLGRYSEAKAEIEHARQIEPTSRSVLASEGLIRYWAGDREAGIAQLQELETTEPDFSAPSQYLAQIYFNERNYPAYIDRLKRRANLTRNPGHAALASAAAAGFKQGGERGMLERMRAVYLPLFQKGEISGYDLVIVCARLGRTQEADRYLQAALDTHDHHVIRVIKGNLDADMRGDDRYEQLKRTIQQRIKLPSPSNAGG
jgi:tetratricopeptide (TPR) repeat protein